MGRLYIKFYDIYGKPHARSLRLKDTQENRRRAKIIKKSIESELWRNPFDFLEKIANIHTKITLSEVCEKMLEEQSGDRKASTIRQIRLGVSHFVKSQGDLPIRAITVNMMRRYRDQQVERFGKANARNFIASLSPIFSFAILKGRISASPITRKVRIEAESKAPIVFLDSDLHATLLWLKKTHGIDIVRQLLFLLLTGFRSNESCQLQRKQINFTDQYIEHNNIKGKRVEPFPLYRKLTSLLQFCEGYDPNAFVFHFRSTATLSKYLHNAVDKLGLNPAYNVHTLKKTFVTRLSRKHIPIYHLQSLANHKSIETTLKHYVWFNLEEKRKYLEQP